MTELQISSDLSLPLDAATGTFGILATKGAGKSNAAVVLAEQMYDAGIPWVAIDPKGDWHGVRSSADGKGPGLPIPVFGGRHGDVPLEPTAGAMLAELVLSKGLTCVLDVSQFTKADVTRFLLAFGRYLFTHADDDGAEPIHLFLEEAHEYLPQKVTGDQATNVEVWQRIVKQGRFKGLGCTLISQRSSVLNKDVLELVDTLIVLRTIGPRSRESIKEWVKDQDVDAGLLASLPSLGDGEAWVWSPGALRILQRIQFNRRRTFDSGATPKVGEKRRQPSTIADVDLASIKEAMAETIEKAKADDPKELRKRIAELERELAAERAFERTRIEQVRVFTQDDERVLGEVDESVAIIAGTLADLRAGVLARLPEEPVTQTRQGAAPSRVAQPATQTPVPGQPRGRSGPQAPRPAATPPQRAERRPVGDGSLTGPQQRILDALAWLNAVGFPTPSKLQVGFIAGYRVGKKVGGTYGNVLGQLRAAELIDYPSAGSAMLTDAGRAVATPADIERSTEGLQAAVFARLADPEQRVLAGIITDWPDPISKQEAGQRAGYAVGDKVGGTFGNILGRLRSLGLIDYPAPGLVVATDVLFLDA